MAIAGSMTTAYRMQIRGGCLRITPTTHPMRDCDPPAEAIAKILAGQEAVVSGGDAWAVREGVTGETIRGEVQP